MVQRVDDPTLPKPWAKLAEGDTVYYWNEETGVTQYERPALPTSSQPSSVRTHAHAPQRPYITRSMTHTCVRSFVVPRLRYSESMHQCIIIIDQVAPTNGYHEAGVPPTSQGPVSADEYRRQHHLSVQGAAAPEPYQLFEQAPFSPDIMDEVSLFDRPHRQGPGRSNPACSTRAGTYNHRPMP